MAATLVRMTSSLLLAILAAVGLLSEASMAAAPNLVRDGTFEIDGSTKTLPPTWGLTGSVKQVAFAKDHAEGNISLKLESMPGQGLRLYQEIDVRPRTEYLFTAVVKSKDRVVATVRNVTMSYHRQGEWQTLVGMIRTGDESKLTVSFDIAGLSRKAPSALIDAVELRQFDRPTAVTRKVDASVTQLVDAAKPQAILIYPAEIESYKMLAEQVQRAIAEKTGATLPILSDVEATGAGPPVLKAELEEQNLILIGRLGINRAMWPAYNRYLDATDGYYPGGDGYVVRTAANVFGNGKNHIILGGSTENGAARAVQQFIEKHLPQAAGTKSTLSLPWLLDVQLDGAALAAIQEHDATWTNNPNDPSLPPIEPGYGTVRRWYENAMGYYWTGWDSYRQRAIALLDPVLADKSYCHHYVTEFFARTFDMIDDGPLLSAEQRSAVDALLLSNFLDLWTEGGDASWMTTFSPPYDSIYVVNRHQIAPWMADLTLAEFVGGYLESNAEVAALAEFRRSEKDGLMRHLAAERYDTSLPGGVTTEHEEELALTLLRYALGHDDYRLFETGHAHRVPLLERINHLTGHWVRPGGRMDSKLMFGALASYYRDGRYLTLIEKIPSGPPFMRRYLAGIRCYTPGAEVQPTRADSLAGVQLPEMMPHRQRQLPGLESPQFAAVKFPPKQALDFVSFRSGFEPSDDYVALTGLMAPGSIPGIFLSFTSRGMNWLGSDSAEQYSVPTDRYFDRNGVHVMRSDRWSDDEKPYSVAAQLNWSANLHRAGGVSFACDPFVGTRWQRDVVWIRPGLYVVRDQVTAREAGQYQVAVNWRPAGGPSWDGKAWTSVARAGHFRLTPLGDEFDVQQNVDAFLAGEADSLHLRHTAFPKLVANQAIAAIAVLQAFSPGEEPVLNASLAGKNAVYLEGIDQRDDRALIAWSGAELKDVSSDAQVLVLRPGMVQLIGGTHLDIAGTTFVKSDRSVQLLADLVNGKLRIDIPASSGASSVQLIDASGALGPAMAAESGQELDIPKAPQAALIALSAVIAPPVASSSSDRTTMARAPQPDAGSIKNQIDQWNERWRYEGLRQPLMVRTARTVAADIVDFGRVVDLAAILPAAITSGAWFVRPLPDEIFYSVGDDAGNPPPTDSPLWKKIEQAPKWIAGARTGNYGETDRIDEDTQVLHLAGVQARYIRAENPARLVFMDGQRLGVQQPLTLQFTGSGASQRLFVSPRIWPKYVGWSPHWRDQLAMLDASDGTEIFRHTAEMKLMDAQLLPIDDTDTRRVTIATIDGRIQTLDDSGAIARDLDLREMQLEFNRKFGRTNTRHPAGGFAMPFSIGTWRSGPSAAPGMVIARYHAFSYLDSAGRLEGLMHDGSYVQPALLPQGIDFDGDGADEQICLARGVLIKVHGPKDQRILEPNGHLFFPQIYHLNRLEEPAWDERLDGPRVRLFQPLTIGQSAADRPRYLAVARENYVGIYDGMEHRWNFTWVPLVSVCAAAVVEDTANRLHMLVATEDGLLWELRFIEDALDRLAKLDAQRFDDAITQLTSDGAGGAIIAGHGGLYHRLADGIDLARIAEGAFADVRVMPVGASEGAALVAAHRDGSIIRLDLRKPMP